MDKFARLTCERTLLAPGHDVAAAGNLLVHLISVAGLINLILFHAAVIGDKLHGGLVEPLLFLSCLGLSRLRVSYRSASQLIADIVVCVLNVTYSKQQSLGHTVPYSLYIALCQIPAERVIPRSYIVFRGFLSSYG